MDEKDQEIEALTAELARVCTQYVRLQAECEEKLRAVEAQLKSVRTKLRMERLNRGLDA